MNYIIDIINESLINLALLAFPLIISFAYVNLLRSLFLRSIMSQRLSSVTYRVLGLIGTPLHEISHLIVAIFFGHKINQVKLFAWNNDAYVLHSYNENSMWQSLGCLFIAIAPFLTSIALIHMINGELITQSLSTYESINGYNYLLLVQDILSNFFVESSLYEVVTILIVSHYCTPSNSDFSNAFKSIFISLPTLLVLIAVLNYFFDLSYLYKTIMFLAFSNLASATIAFIILRALALIR